MFNFSDSAYRWGKASVHSCQFVDNLWASFNPYGRAPPPPAPILRGVRGGGGATELKLWKLKIPMVRRVGGGGGGGASACRLTKHVRSIAALLIQFQI